MAITYSFGATNPVVAPVATDKAISVGDLVALSSGSAISALDFPWDTDLATTQENFAGAFLGVSGQLKRDDIALVYGNSVANQIRIDCSGIYEGTYTGSALLVGDFVGPTSVSNVLQPQSLVKVATVDLAIGTVVEALSGTGTVKFQLLSAKNPVAR
jgi:hypothetical protein